MASKRRKVERREAPKHYQRRKATMAKKHHDDEERHTEPVEVEVETTPGVSPEEVDRAVTRISEAFAAAVPEEALKEGSCELPKDDPVRQLRTKVPDGSYRVTGHEWVLDFAGGHLVGVTRVTADTSPSNYTSVPQARS
jgi:hypothetical protein